MRRRQELARKNGSILIAMHIVMDAQRGEASLTAGSRVYARVALVFPAVLRVLAMAWPTAFALRSLGNSAQATHDANLVRAAGLEHGPVFHALDAMVASAFAQLPLGSRSFRLSLSSVVLTGLLGLLCFELARSLLRSADDAGGSSSKLSLGRSLFGDAIALLASFTFTLSPLVQLETHAPAGAVLGVTLVLGTWTLARLWPFAIAQMAFLVGLSIAEEPILGLASCAVLLGERLHTADIRRHAIAASSAFLAGIVPLLWRLFATWGFRAERLSFTPMLGDASLSDRRSCLVFLRSEVGVPILLLAALGILLCVYEKSRRQTAYSPISLILIGALALYLGAPMGAFRFGAAVLLGYTALLLFAAICAGELLSRIYHLRIPLSGASAALVLVLFVAAPLRMMDESDTRLFAQRHDATPTWEDLAFDALPPKALVLIRDARLLLRTQAARASGSLRPDLSIVPISALQARGATTVLAREPALTPLLRDILLTGTPQEITLSTLASAKPLCVEFAHTWPSSLARHLLPVGLFMQYEGEPRGASERRLGLDGQTVLRDRLGRALMAGGDPELSLLTIRALRLRAMSTALTGERSSTVRTLEDLRVFSPKDPIMEELIRRALVSKGYIEIADLNPYQ
jgi:hypothetical protein